MVVFLHRHFIVFCFIEKVLIFSHGYGFWIILNLSNFIFFKILMVFSEVSLFTFAISLMLLRFILVQGMRWGFRPPFGGEQIIKIS